MLSVPACLLHCASLVCDFTIKPLRRGSRCLIYAKVVACWSLADGAIFAKVKRHLFFCLFVPEMHYLKPCTINVHVSAHSFVSCSGNYITVKYMRYEKNKYCHYFKWRLCRAVSGESNVKTAVYRCVIQSLLSV